MEQSKETLQLASAGSTVIQAEEEAGSVGSPRKRIEAEASTSAEKTASGLTCRKPGSNNCCDASNLSLGHGSAQDMTSPMAVSAGALNGSDSPCSSGFFVLDALLASARPPPSEFGGTCCALAAELLSPVSPPQTSAFCASAAVRPRPLQILLELPMEAQRFGGSACSEMLPTLPLPPEMQPVSPGVLELQEVLQEINSRGPRITPSTKELLAVSVYNMPSSRAARADEVQLLQTQELHNQAAARIQSVARGRRARLQYVEAVASEVITLRCFVKCVETCLLPGLVAQGAVQKAALRCELLEARSVANQAEAEATRLRGQLSIYEKERRSIGGG